MRSQDKVPPFSVDWDDFYQAEDPATDPANEVGPGKRWVETDDTANPTQIVAVWKRTPDGTAWLPYPMGALAVGGDADTLQTHPAADFVLATALDTDGTLAADSDAKIATQKATKTYIDGKVAGLSWKAAVRAATTVAGTLATSFENGDTIDGVTLATGNRILIKNQAAPEFNGIYTVNASGAPTRATDADTAAEVLQATVYVEEGTANADTAWTMTTNAPITLNTTGLVFAQFGAGTSYAADGSTLQLVGSTFSVKAGGVSGTELTNNIRDVAIPFIIDGGGAVITTGIKGDVEVPCSGTLIAWTLLGDQSGSITIDTWKDTYANFPPVVGDTMWGTKPALSAVAKNQATGLSIAVTAGDIIRYNVDSAATVQRVTLSFTIRRS